MKQICMVSLPEVVDPATLFGIFALSAPKVLAGKA